MNTTEYIGTFKNEFSRHEYTLTVHCFGFLQAYFLLTADAIRSGRHWGLDSIESDKEKVRVNEIKANQIFKGRKPKK